ncbi:putative HTH-type transcriptional regulator LgoR [Polaromonas vacuolata]|uniref:Putative HTH-type transcriptional regulator LgoR n=1 Tax=Polaromonas vacuolata TaxID=37448 RepID=A0A6H2HAT4_9BURK|nr:GntR family transcriptional regulator [Polaromonas vacuolata]QJC56991.1 putative HTH-type transcriptional regulator LgoR [Polaromonas vacuolata]
MKKISSKPGPIYAEISHLLRRAIKSGLIEKGLVLIEGHVAELLGATRTPVRQALSALKSEGLISRFDGRGYTAGPAGLTPLRRELEASMLGITAARKPVRKLTGWQAIYETVERDVVHLSVFGDYRINEVELARHYSVGRMAARDVLLRLERLGITEKDERSRWRVTPLNDNRIEQLYELRWLLEPAALASAMTASTATKIQSQLQTSPEKVGSKDSKSMMANLRKAIHSYPKVDRQALDELENDLHVDYLAQCPNKELLQSLERTRCLLTLGKHVLGKSAPMPPLDPFLAEHLAIFKAIDQQDSLKAQDLLRTHLEKSSRKVLLRAAHVRENFSNPKLSYIELVKKLI